MVQGNLLEALELTELGAQLVAQRHRRDHPDDSEDQVRGVVAAWFADRRQAPDGGVGRLVTWPRTR